MGPETELTVEHGGPASPDPRLHTVKHAINQFLEWVNIGIHRSGAFCAEHGNVIAWIILVGALFSPHIPTHWRDIGDFLDYWITTIFLAGLFKFMHTQDEVVTEVAEFQLRRNMDMARMQVQLSQAVTMNQKLQIRIKELENAGPRVLGIKDYDA